MDSKGIIRKRLAQHRDIIEQILADEKLQDTIAQITDTIVTCFKYGGRVYFCGNGGSAADAQHLAAEFSGKFYLERDILPSEALHCNSSYITAVSNDLRFRDHLLPADFGYRKGRRCPGRLIHFGQLRQHRKGVRDMP